MHKLALAFVALAACVVHSPPPRPQGPQPVPMYVAAPVPMTAQVCQSGSTCSFACDGGGCAFACAGGSICNVQCDGGNCTVDCQPGAVCNEQCDGGNCHEGCAEGSTCNVECDGGGCT